VPILKHAWSSALDVLRFVIWIIVFTVSVFIIAGCAALLWVITDALLGLMGLWAIPCGLLVFLMSAWFTVFITKVFKAKE